MADLIATVTSAVALVRQLAELNAKSKDAKLHDLIGDLTLEMSKLKSQMAQLIDENTDLKAKLKKATGNPGAMTVGEHGLYYDMAGDGPFCTCCYDVQKQRVRVVEVAQMLQHAGRFKCPSCNTRFK